MELIQRNNENYPKKIFQIHSLQKKLDISKSIKKVKVSKNKIVLEK